MLDVDDLIERLLTIRLKANTMTDETAAVDCNVIIHEADAVRAALERLRSDDPQGGDA